MNIKIREVELQSFRAYKDRQLFDFTNSKGDVANLVVIFAPNGFGKTSLLDAIEWGLTKQINRFSNNEVLKKVARLEKGIILKNRGSSEPNGSVKLTDDKGKTVLLHTQVKGRKYRSDYNEGIEIECSSELGLVRDSALAKDNILSHDKIESFLLFSSGGDRYEALAKFWDYSNDTLSYKTIYVLWNEVKKEIADKNKYLKKLVNDIKDLYLPIDDLNSYINKINSFKIKDILLSNISSNVSEQELTLLIEKTITQKSLLITQVREVQQNMINIDQLFSSLPEYEQKLSLHRKLEFNIKDIQSQINKLDLRAMLDKQENDLREEIISLTRKLEMLDTLKEKGVSFVRTNTLILKAQQDITRNDESIIHFKKINHQISSQILEIEINCEKNKKVHDNYIEESEKIIQRARQYKKLDANLRNLEIRLKRLKNVSKKRSEKLQLIKSNIIELDYLMKLDIAALLDYKFEDPTYVEMIYSLKGMKSNIDFLKGQRKKKKQEYSQLGRLNDDLNEVVKIGRQIIQTSKTSECPMCSTPFSNFEALLSRVDTNIGNIFQLKLIDQEIKNLENDIEIQELTYKDLLASLMGKLKDELKANQEKSKIEYQKVQRLNVLSERTARQESDKKEQLEILYNYFCNHDPKFNKDNFDKDIYKINKNLSNKLEKKKELIIEADKELNVLNEQINKNKELILLYERINTQSEVNIRNLKLDPGYEAVSNYLNLLGVSFDTNAILEKETVLNKNLNIINDKMLQIQLSIQEIEKNQPNKEVHELNKLLKDLKDERENCKEFLINYSSRYGNYFQSSEISEFIFEQEQDKLERDLKSKKELLSIFDILHENLQYTSGVFKSSSKIKDKNNISAELKRLNEIQGRLSDSLQKSQQLIDEKINKAFNIDAINKIYSKIEPHPELKFMEIVPSFIGDKPSLDIYAPMGEERKDNPVLFFSSAQLDILSLSIFLAKALMEPKPLLNTIFMDDPVHHMDSINVLSFIDLLRTLTLDLNRQIVITTHNEHLFKLIEQKIDPNFCNSKFIQLDSHGRVAVNS